MPSSDPVLALEKRLVKDRIYADRIVSRARARDIPVLVNDGSRSLVPDAEAVISVPAGMRNVGAARRWENEVSAANIRAWMASPEAPGFDPMFTWSCECGRPGCDAVLRMTLTEYDCSVVRSAH